VEKLTEVERWLAPYADQIITVNKSIAEFMTIRYGVQLPEIILNCPAMPKQMGLPIPNTDILRQELGIPQTKKIILYQGIYSLARNLQGVIAAMGLVKNPNVVFVLMGPGLEKDNELMHQAKNMGILNSKVFFRAAVDQDHLLLYSASADAGIIPYPYTELNNYFCTPNKLFEFIVAGIPILANDLPELNRFVAQQGVGINLPLRTPKEISDAIDSFFSLDNIAYRLRAQSVSEKFTWDSQSEKLVNIYSALFNKPARFKTSQEEILPPKVLWDKETQKPDIQSNDDKPPEYSKNSEVQLSFKHMPPQNPISIPFALQPYSTIVLLNEIKRRLIIRAHQILQKL
jgi:glycosyltransferase involved in cell wall biosynthesis